MDTERNHYQPQKNSMDRQAKQNQYFQADFSHENSLENTNVQLQRQQYQIPQQNHNELDFNFDMDLSDNEKDSTTTPTIKAYPRFSDIQKSFEIMRKAIPQIFTNQTIDSLYEIIVKKTAKGSRNSSEFVFEQDSQVKLQENSYIQIKGLKNKMASKIDNGHYIFNRSQAYDDPNQMNYWEDQKSIYKKSFNSVKYETKKYLQSDIQIPKRKILNSKQEVKKFEEQKIKTTKKLGNAVGSDEKIEGINLSQQLQKIWGAQMQDLLVSLYQQGHKFSFIKNEFRQRFPEHAPLFTVDTIRIKLKKLIRASIRLLQQNLQNPSKHNLPQLVKMSDQMIKIVMHHCEAMSLRLLLLQIYISERCDISLIRNTIIRANQFFRHHYHRQLQ